MVKSSWIVYLCLSCVSCESQRDRLSVSYMKARKEARGSRTWVSSKSLVVPESEESEEEKQGFT